MREFIDASEGNLDLIYDIRTICDTDECFLHLNTLIIRGMENRYQGVGTAALQSVIDVAINRGCAFIQLKADTKQPQKPGFVLVDWYKKYGFKEIGKDGYFVTMRKDLI